MERYIEVDVPKTGDSGMRTRRWLLIVNLTVGLLLNDLSFAQSRAVTAVPHTGMSQEALERAYIESYQQSGFRLASRDKQSLPAGSWMVVLVFQLKNAPEGPDAPGTTLIIMGDQPDGCEPCELSRQTFRGPDADNPDPAVFARGRQILIEADTAALTKLRQRLGTSLPVVEMPTTP